MKIEMLSDLEAGIKIKRCMAYAKANEPYLYKMLDALLETKPRRRKVPPKPEPTEYSKLIDSLWSKMYEAAEENGRQIFSKKADYCKLFEEVGKVNECREVMLFLLGKENREARMGYKTALFNANELRVKWNRILEAMERLKREGSVDGKPTYQEQKDREQEVIRAGLNML